MFAPGQILAGKYRIERVLGEGGMGMVVAATHMGLGTPVALKFLHPHLVGHESLMQRFVREARASAQLRSEHVCRVSDVGTFEDGTAYIVMELLEGFDLSSTLRARGPMPPQLACDYVLQACLGIAEAHQVGIVHRDLKPANLFVTMRPDGTPLVKVLDFGVAKAPQEGNFSLTQTSNVMGSPGYMSPEQLRSSKEADARSDIWSLGVTLYELIAGRQPWTAESITELTLRIAMDPLPPLPPTTPPGLAAVIARCMEKDPAARYPHIAAFAAALAPFASPSGQAVAAGVSRVLRGSAPSVVNMAAVGAAPTIATAGTTLQASTGALTTPPSKRSWKLPAAILSVCVAAGVIATIALTGGSSSDEKPAAAPSPSPSPPPSPSPSPPPPPSPSPSPPPPPPVEATPPPTPPPPPAAGSATPPAPKSKKPRRFNTNSPAREDDINDSRF